MTRTPRQPLTQQTNTPSAAPYGQTQTQPQPPKPSKDPKKPLIAGLVITSVLAAVGIAFGVYGLLSTQKKSDEIAEMRADLSALESATKVESSATGETTTLELSDSTLLNPVIAATSPEIYFVNKEIKFHNGADSAWTSINLNLKDGAIDSCQIFHENTFQGDCTISGLTGKIYKIATAGEGQNVSDPEIAFIMEDGTVSYLSASTIANSASPTIEGTYNIDGFVTDIFDVNVGSEDSPVGGYGTSLFILSDGSYLPYAQVSKN